MYEFFDGVKTLNELKDRYRALAKKWHPDLGGDGETMKRINDEHDRLFEILKAKQNAAADADETRKTRYTTETAEEFRDIIVELLKIADITVELCGSWVWVTGNTLAHKDELKKLGLRWSGNKKAWYWRHPERGGHWSGGADMAWIRKKYGSVVVVKGSNPDEAVAVA